LKFEYQQHKFLTQTEIHKLELDDNTNINNSNNNFNQYLNNGLGNSNNSIHHTMLIDNILGNFSNNNGDLNLLNERILPFNNNHNLCQSSAPNSFLKNLKNYEPKHNLQNNDKNIRVLPKLPERVLDAPELSDDFYLNLLDWSSKNVLAIVLGSTIYLWNAETGQNNVLTESIENICSINWMNSGTCLAVGLESGAVQLWDTNRSELLRTMTGHTDRVTALSWNEYILSSGSRDSKIFNNDVRIQSHITSTYLGHKYEVCGLKWSPDGVQLASGGGDNKICIWDVNKSSNINPLSALVHEIDHDMNNNNYTNFNNNNNFNYEIIEDSDSSNNSRSYNNYQINTNMNVNMNTNTNMFVNPNRAYSMNNVNSIGLEQGFLNNINLNGNHNSSQTYLSKHISSLRNLGILTYINLFNILANLHPKNTINVKPLHKFSKHHATVKALAWCPFEKRILASGGGSNDPSIKLWNTDSGTMNYSLNTESQVCSLLWNRFDKELVSSHGIPKYQISVWSYPSLKNIGDLTGHTSKVLHMAMSPDGTTICSGAGGGDETLRFWKLFENKTKVEIFENFDYNYFNKNEKSTLNFQNSLR